MAHKQTQFPAWLYSAAGKARLFHSAEEVAATPVELFDSPQAAEAAKAAKPKPAKADKAAPEPAAV